MMAINISIAYECLSSICKSGKHRCPSIECGIISPAVLVAVGICCTKNVVYLQLLSSNVTGSGVSD